MVGEELSLWLHFGNISHKNSSGQTSILHIDRLYVTSLPPCSRTITKESSFASIVFVIWISRDWLQVIYILRKNTLQKLWHEQKKTSKTLYTCDISTHELLSSCQHCSSGPSWCSKSHTSCTLWLSSEWDFLFLIKTDFERWPQHTLAVCFFEARDVTKNIAASLDFQFFFCSAWYSWDQGNMSDRHTLDFSIYLYQTSEYRFSRTLICYSSSGYPLVYKTQWTRASNHLYSRVTTR